jgi:hypothetical protein
MPWFYDLMGFVEENNVKDNVKITGLNEDYLKSEVNGKEYKIGFLDTSTLGELKLTTSMLTIKDNTPNTITEVVSDVKDIYNNPNISSNALFQVASQFNLLEMATPSHTPHMGVGIYEYDHTQGPASAISCGAATIYRNYFMQDTENQINCLKEIEYLLDNDNNNYWKVINGYAMFDTDKLDQLNEQIKSIGADKIKNNLEVGLQKHCQVTLNDCSHEVSQIFCSALPIAYHNNSMFEASDESFAPFAKIILEAAYEATINAAIINKHLTGNPVVYLTLLGDGAFGNPSEWIIDSLNKVLNSYKHNGLDIIIVSYNKSNPELRKIPNIKMNYLLNSR